MSERVPSAWQLGEAMRVLMQYRDKLRDDPELEADQDLLADFMASDPESCDAFEVLHRLGRAAIAAEDQGKLARVRAAEIVERARRFDRREASLRETLKAGMQALDIRRISQPDFSASIGKGKGRVVVTGELADEWVKIERTPKLADIGKALDAGEEVENAVRSNAEPQLSIRRS